MIIRAELKCKQTGCEADPHSIHPKTCKVKYHTERRPKS